mgnify:CR=1 FL=1
MKRSLVAIVAAVALVGLTACTPTDSPATGCRVKQAGSIANGASKSNGSGCVPR